MGVMAEACADDLACIVRYCGCDFIPACSYDYNPARMASQTQK